MAAVLNIESEVAKAKMLIKLASKKSNSSKLIEDAVNNLQSIREDWPRIEALTEIAIFLAEQNFPKYAISVAKQIRASDQMISKRLLAIAEIVSHLNWQQSSNQGERISNILMKLETFLLDLSRPGFQFTTDISDMVHPITERLKFLASQVPRLSWNSKQAIERFLQEDYLRELAFMPLESNREFSERKIQIISEIQTSDLIWIVSERLSTLAELTPYLPQDLKQSVVAEVISDLDKMKLKENQARILSILSPHLQEDQLQTALEIVENIDHNEYKVTASVALAPRLPRQDRETVLKNAIDALEKLKLSKKYASMLSNLIAVSSVRLLPDVMVLTTSIEEKEKRQLALNALAIRLTELPEPQAQVLLLNNNLLRSLSTRTREQFLADIRSLEPIFMKLGGAEAIRGIASAIQDVGRWWP